MPFHIVSFDGTQPVNALWTQLISTAALSTATSSSVVLGGKYSTVLLGVSGAYTGVTINVQITTDDGNKTFVPLLRFDQSGYDDGTSVALTNNSSRSWLIPVSGMSGIELDVAAISTGTLDVSFEISSAPFVFQKAKTKAATLSNVSSSASNVTLLSANVQRKGVSLFNDSTAVLYLKLGATASTTSYSYYLVPGAHWELPFEYTGIIDGIWAAADGAARITELT